MSKFIDTDNNIVDISIYNKNDISWEDDFYDVGNLKFESVKTHRQYDWWSDVPMDDEGDMAFAVDDVYYLIEQMNDMLNGVGDYDNGGEESDGCYAVVVMPDGSKKAYGDLNDLQKYLLTL